MRLRPVLSIFLIPVFFLTFAPLSAQQLSETYTTNSGDFEFDYPAGWVVSESDDGTLIVANMDSALDILDNDPISGEFGMAVFYGDLSQVMDINGITASTSTTETLSNLSSALLTSIAADNPTLVVGDAEPLENVGEAASYYPFSDQGYDGFIIVTLMDSSTFVVSLGAAITGELPPYRPVAIDITGSFRIAGSQPPGTTGGMFSSLVEHSNAQNGIAAPGGKNRQSGDLIRQWATSATASTEYSTPSWAAFQAVGVPDTPECGDIATAWASSNSTGEDWLRLEYDIPVTPQEINIYETYNPGSIVKVQVFADGDDVTIDLPNSADPPNNTPCPGVFTITIDEPMPAISAVTIYVNQTIGGSWNEIDAVELVGVIP